jgi:hypothetical protein
VPAGVSLDVSSWEVLQLEARGGPANQWLRQPDNGLWLYKPTRTNKINGHLQGEDWAEKAVEQLAMRLGVPVAQVEVTYTRRGDRHVQYGVVSRDLAPDPLDLQGGQNLLGEVQGYRYRDERGAPPKNRVGHTVGNIQRLFAEFGVAPPVGFEPASFTAFDVFAGFLMLDAWVGNQDRHEENWAVLVTPSGALSLAPSFDHGASLGSIRLEQHHVDMTADPAALEAFALGGCAKRMENGHKVQLVTVAADALQRASPTAREYWLDRLSGMTPETCATVLDGVPRLSDASRNFCLELLEVNRRRLLDVC